MERLKKEAKDLAEHFRRGSETFYLGLVIGFLCCYLLYQVHWSDPVVSVMGKILPICNTVLLAVLLVYVLVILVSWRRRIWILIPACALFALTYYAAQHMHFKPFFLTVGIFMALLACGKDYRRILKCYFFCHVGVILLALLGLALGFATDSPKVEEYGVGHSFGIVYPNNFAHILFLVLVLAWYLYLHRHKWATLAAFWCAVLPVWLVCKCRTIVIFLVLFPILALLLERRSAGTHRLPAGPRRVRNALIVAAPFIMLGLTLLLCSQIEFMQRAKYTVLYNMASRFVQGGIALRYYGVPLFGKAINTSGEYYLFLNGGRERLVLMDNAYVTYLIEEGAIWMFFVTAWYCLVNLRCIRDRNRRLLLIACFMLVLGLMERAGLTAVYNFTALYPLTAALKKADAPAREGEVADP